jgi:hypothetical protein
MRNKSYDEAIRFQAIAVERAHRIEDLIMDQKMMKLEHAIQMLEAANKIAKLERQLLELTA